eukprot:TRINITY_DN18984_c0_g1_i2.p1 TRINITY_DN18984_c0_g1~~TRINITY_DN18984_c0_g1_i2.p1  ORF type:complete len:555 (+),score=116.22 TRINITY_DN18984_c0_g1_i2:23-1666(+)
MDDYADEHKIDRLFCNLHQKILTEKPESPLNFLIEQLEKLTETKAPPSPSSAKRSRSQHDIPVSRRYSPELDEKALSIVVLGASGDLAKKKTYPALFELFCQGLLPAHATIVGYARSELKRDDFLGRLSGGFKKNWGEKSVAAFLERCDYVSGAYDSDSAFTHLHQHLHEKEQAHPNGANRVFYLALPPSVFVTVAKAVRHAALSPSGFNRVIVEKPFGKDLESSNALAAELGALFKEEQIYRIDHYLGKEMVQNIVSLRFANKVLSSVWNNVNVANVQIVFKEPFGTEGRGGYFDQFGIVRDVIQNHLLQVLALVAMEKPKDLTAERIRDEKVHVLSCIDPVTIEDCVFGQYTKSEDGKEMGYLEDPTVPKGSVTPTFATCVLHINNDRWQGVPFILKAGKALNERKAEPFGNAAQRNELVIRVQPAEAIYLKMMVKLPGLSTQLTQTELDLSYNTRYTDVTLPDAYEGLIYDVLTGNQGNFVRTDELQEAWRIFTPLLHQYEREKIQPLLYTAGTRGPPQSDLMVQQKYGYMRTDYEWRPPTANL